MRTLHYDERTDTFQGHEFKALDAVVREDPASKSVLEHLQPKNMVTLVECVEMVGEIPDTSEPQNKRGVM